MLNTNILFYQIMNNYIKYCSKYNTPSKIEKANESNIKVINIINEINRLTKVSKKKYKKENSIDSIIEMKFIKNRKKYLIKELELSNEKDINNKIIAQYAYEKDLANYKDCNGQYFIMINNDVNNNHFIHTNYINTNYININYINN